MNQPTETDITTEIVPAAPAPAMISISTGASIQEVVARRRLIKELMKEVLVEGEHYGKIPGTDKNTLLKSGAEKVASMFNLGPKIVKEDVIDLGEGHREYRLTIGLWHYPTGMFVGEGTGSCSTMESKYRYRNVSDYEIMDQRIPADWKEKKDHYRKQGYGAKKVEGQWAWVKYGDQHKEANPDIADVFNTCLKMAKKRAYIDAVLTSTAASDFFTQDMEDGPGNGGGGSSQGNKEKPVAGPTAPKKAASEAPWEAAIQDVEEEERPPGSGKMVYTVKFKGGREADTADQQLAARAYDLMVEDLGRVLKATVKPGRTPGKFVLVGVEP